MHKTENGLEIAPGLSENGMETRREAKKEREEKTADRIEDVGWEWDGHGSRACEMGRILEHENDCNQCREDLYEQNCDLERDLSTKHATTWDHKRDYKRNCFPNKEHLDLDGEWRYWNEGEEKNLA